MNILAILLSIIYLFIDVYIYRTSQSMLDTNYQCKCGQTWQIKRLTEIIFSIICIQLGVLIISFVMTLIGNNTALMIVSKLLGLGMIALLGLQIYYIYLMITYVNDLKQNKCLCVDETFTNTLFYYGWFKIISLVMAIIILTVLIFFFYVALKASKNPELTPSTTSSIKKSFKKSSKSSKK